jgi:hypothetical protein
MAWSRRRRWTDDELRAAIASSSSYRMAAACLGSTESRRGVKARARALGLDVSHFPDRRGLTRWTDDDLRTAVASSPSVAAVLRALGLVAAGGNYQHVTREIARLGLDTAHFTGQGWNRGRSPSRARPLEEVLVAGRWTSSRDLRERLIRAGLKQRACELCGWAQGAADGRVPVELDHINGDHDDNRLENLRILCPNCHALQPTHRGLNKKSRRR